MSETVWVAVIAVLGTSLGAAISPIVGVIREVLVTKSGAKSERLRAAATFGEALTKYARIAPDQFQAHAVRTAHTLAVEKRFDLAQHLPRGAGQVDRFAECAIKNISLDTREEGRLAVAEFATTMVLDWARGDRDAKLLGLFEMVKAGEEWIAVSPTH